MQKGHLFLSTLLALACLVATSTSAYQVVYTSKSGTSYQNYLYTQGGCSQYDITLNNPMPSSAANNEAVKQAYSSGGLTSDVPLGGIAEQAACFTELCEWSWNQGVHYFNKVTFMKGTFSASNPATSATKTDAYSNFATGYPIAWDYTYWGARLPVMGSSGSWTNANLGSTFTEYVCEGYKFEASDASEYGFATYPNGDVIDPRSYVGVSQRSHCGHKLEVDKSGRWIDVQCKKPFPWWAGVVIAVVCFVVVVTVIIVIMCICLCNRNRKDTKEKEHRMAADEDNVAHVPTQSQVGLSRDTVLSSHASKLGTSADLSDNKIDSEKADDDGDEKDVANEAESASVEMPREEGNDAEIKQSEI